MGYMREIRVLLTLLAQQQDVPPGTIRTLCAWCGAWLGDKPAGSAAAGISHGICQTCSNDFMRKNGIDPDETPQDSGEYIASSLHEVQELLWRLGP